MHVDEREIGQRQARALQRHGCCEYGPHQQVAFRRLGGEGIAADIGQRLVAERLGTRLAHQDHGRRAVGERAGIGRGHAAELLVEHRLELVVAFALAVLAHEVVVGDRHGLVARAHERGHALFVETAVSERGRRVAVRGMGQIILLGAGHAPGLGHLLGGFAHRLAGRILGDRRLARNQILRAQPRQNLEPVAVGLRLRGIAQRIGHALGQRDRDIRRGIRTAGHHHVGVAQGDGLGAAGRGLKARRAGAGDGIRVGTRVHARREHDLAADERRLRLHDRHAENGLFDLAGREPGARQHFSRGHRAQIHGVRIAKRRGNACKRRTHAGHDGDTPTRAFHRLGIRPTRTPGLRALCRHETVLFES